MSSMDHNIKRHFAVQLRAFGALGIDFTQKDDVLTKPWLTCVFAVSTMLVLLAMLHFSWAHLTDLDEVADAITPFLQYILALWKIYIFVVKRKHMMKLLQRLWALKAQDIENEMSVVFKENANIMFYNNIYSISIIGTVIMGMITPIIVDLFFYIYKGEWNFLVPFKATYFVDQTKPFMCCVIFLIDGVAFYTAANGSVGVDSLYSWFVHNIVAQLKMLKVKIAQVNTDFERGVPFPELETSLIDCIKHHQIIISLAEQFDTLFRPIVFVEFTLSALQVCFLAFQMAEGVALANLPFLCGFFVAITVQLMIYAYGGERLQNESESIALTLYSTLPWPMLPIRSRKLIIFGMMRAQKPLKVTAIFFDVGFSQFLLVYRTAASYVTLLRSMDLEEGAELVA